MWIADPSAFVVTDRSGAEQRLSPSGAWLPAGASWRRFGVVGKRYATREDLPLLGTAVYHSPTWRQHAHM